MASLNKVLLVGNLTKDPELRFVPSGQAVANLRLATNRKYKAASGEWKEEVTYVSVEVWGKSAEACGEYLKKGSPLLVEGRLKLKEWTAQDGQKRSVIEVVSERVQFLSGGPGRPGGASAPSADGFDGPPPSDGPPPASDDDIPF
ncbi:MAG TPA: single-stranded DNA-binding protein [bacterium]|jgi:single-strand DNA-binding protein|nr:single-stranded DNA-binding protein [bacterium]